MPNKTVNSIIPIGFGLTGYDFIANRNSQPNGFDLAAGGGFMGGGDYGGVDAQWSGDLVEDRWVADESLKQVQVQTTVFQSAPLQFTRNNQLYYGEVMDGVDQYSYSGTGSFAGKAGAIGARLRPDDINNCKGGSLSSKLSLWANNISRSQSGRTEFYVGTGFCGTTLSHYLQHFYNVSATEQQCNSLAGKKILNIESLFHLGGGRGKAFRARMVDSAGGRGYKGSQNVKGQFYDYDVIDFMIALLLCKGWDELITFKSKTLGVVNQGELKFPWAENGYDYKNGRVPGYGPAALGGLGLTYADDSGIVKGDHGAWQTSGLSAHGHSLARVRFFVDPENMATARSVIPSLPDEFFKTNYAEGEPITGISTGGGSLAESAGNVLGTADKLAKFIRDRKKSGQLGPNSQPVAYYYYSATGGEALISSTNGQTKYDAKDGRVNCDFYVNWVLLEAGITNNTSLHSKFAAEWSDTYVNGACNPGYKAIRVPDINQAQAGDLLVFGKGGAHHVGILATPFANSNNKKLLQEYGMGTHSAPTGGGSMPYYGFGPAKLSCIIRIVKDGTGQA